MDERTRLAGVLRELRELGVRDLYLDGLTADQALDLVRGAPAADAEPSARVRDGAVRRGAAAAPARQSRRPAAPPPESFPGPPRGHGAERVVGTPLHVLAAEASGCTRCGLAGSRTQVVFGRGDPAADLVVVGEAPGGEEDRQGLPFVGPAGKLLDLLLLAAGFPRDRVYICNVLKCRPPSNRDPQADEVASCSPWLHRQLELIRPKVLLAVGKFAGQMLSGSESSISRLRGVVHSYRDIPVVATYHPAYLLRSPHATRGTWQDFQLMRRVLDEHD
ncbi:MAG: uracil-DNA glycosylase [Gemmatimonadetes bacterium]|nr:uracil-DNA glycosylase [Gemmatimonadota bacterium]